MKTVFLTLFCMFALVFASVSAEETFEDAPLESDIESNVDVESSMEESPEEETEESEDSAVEETEDEVEDDDESGTKVCSSTGDPHYRAFNGRRFDYKTRQQGAFGWKTMFQYGNVKVETYLQTNRAWRRYTSNQRVRYTVGRKVTYIRGRGRKLSKLPYGIRLYTTSYTNPRNRHISVVIYAPTNVALSRNTKGLCTGKGQHGRNVNSRVWLHRAFHIIRHTNAHCRGRVQRICRRWRFNNFFRFHSCVRDQAAHCHRRLQKRRCYSTGDPHMGAFNGKRYEYKTVAHGARGWKTLFQYGRVKVRAFMKTNKVWRRYSSNYLVQYTNSKGQTSTIRKPGWSKVQLGFGIQMNVYFNTNPRVRHNNVYIYAPTKIAFSSKGLCRAHGHHARGRNNHIWLRRAIHILNRTHYACRTSVRRICRRWRFRSLFHYHSCVRDQRLRCHQRLRHRQTCYSSGDPHYRAFNGRRFDYKTRKEGAVGWKTMFSKGKAYVKTYLAFNHIWRRFSTNRITKYRTFQGRTGTIVARQGGRRVINMGYNVTLVVQNNRNGNYQNVSIMAPKNIAHGARGLCHAKPNQGHRRNSNIWRRRAALAYRRTWNQCKRYVARVCRRHNRNAFNHYRCIVDKRNFCHRYVRRLVNQANHAANTARAHRHAANRHYHARNAHNRAAAHHLRAYHAHRRAQHAHNRAARKNGRLARNHARTGHNFRRAAHAHNRAAANHLRAHHAHRRAAAAHNRAAHNHLRAYRAHKRAASIWHRRAANYRRAANNHRRAASVWLKRYHMYRHRAAHYARAARSHAHCAARNSAAARRYNHAARVWSNRAAHYLRLAANARRHARANAHRAAHYSRHAARCTQLAARYTNAANANSRAAANSLRRYRAHHRVARHYAHHSRVAINHRNRHNRAARVHLNRARAHFRARNAHNGAAGRHARAYHAHRRAAHNYHRRANAHLNAARAYRHRANVNRHHARRAANRARNSVHRYHHHRRTAQRYHNKARHHHNLANHHARRAAALRRAARRGLRDDVEDEE